MLPVLDSRRAPSTPYAFPLVGHAPQIMWKGLLDVIVDTCGRTGEVKRLMIGRKVAHVVSHPEHLRYVLVDRERNFIKGTALDHLRILLGDGLVTSDGEVWKRARKIAQPAFHRDKMNGLMALAADPIRRLMSSWEREPDGATVDMHVEMKRLVFLISGLTLFGCDLGDDADEATRAFAVALHEIAARIENVYALPLSVPTPGNLRLARAVRTLDRHVRGIVASRKDTSRPDVLSMFMSARQGGSEHFDDAQLRDEVLTLYLAGHDATSHALTWVLHFASRHPEVQQRLHEEASALASDPSTLEDLSRLPYTRMVVQESLRLRPPGALVARQVVVDDEVGGCQLPAGSWVLVVPFLTHYLPEFWPDPDRFDPERFAGEGAARRHACSFYPFGLGSRTCIGNHLAIAEIQLVTSTLLRRYRFEHAPGSAGEMMWRATLQVRGGLKMIRRRRAAAGRVASTSAETSPAVG